MARKSARVLAREAKEAASASQKASVVEEKKRGGSNKPAKKKPTAATKKKKKAAAAPKKKPALAKRAAEHSCSSSSDGEGEPVAKKAKKQQPRTKKQPIASKTKKTPDDFSSSDENQENTTRVKNTIKKTEFTLDSLFDDLDEREERKRECEAKIASNDAQIKEENEEFLRNEKASQERKLATLNEVFKPELMRKELSDEAYGYVFEPTGKALQVPPLEKPNSSCSSFETLYKALQEDSADAMLWGRLIIIRLLAEAKSLRIKSIECPPCIVQWLFGQLSCHSDTHVIKGAFMNLLYILKAGQGPQLISGLSNASFCDFCFASDSDASEVYMEWKPVLNDFLTVFRKYGFNSTKRGMSSKGKMKAKKTSDHTSPEKNQEGRLPFPNKNLEYVITFLILCLRTGNHNMAGHDLFSLTIFFLRMMFEESLPNDTHSLISTCLEELVGCFERSEWRSEWAPLICKRIASAKDGIFTSPYGWLRVARRLPKTSRGIQLTSVLATYVLEHRMTVTTNEAKINVPEPHKLPMPCAKIMNLSERIVDEMTIEQDVEDPDFEIMCIKCCFLDLTMQAFISKLDWAQCLRIVDKIENLTTLKKATMDSKWHELKTITGLLKRKYVLTEEFHKGATKEIIIELDD